MERNWAMLGPRDAIATAGTARQVQRTIWTASHPGTTLRAPATSRRLQRSLGHRVTDEESAWNRRLKMLAFRMWHRIWGIQNDRNIHEGWLYNPVDSNGIDIRDLNIMRLLYRVVFEARLRMPLFDRDYEDMPELMEVVEGWPTQLNGSPETAHGLYQSLMHRDTQHFPQDNVSSEEEFW